MRELSLENYHHYCAEFLQALADRFEGTPHGPIFREQRLKYDLAITHSSGAAKAEKKESLVAAFYQQMQPKFAAVNEGNLEAILDVPFVQDLGLGAAIQESDPDTRLAIKDYLCSMIQAAVMWSVYRNIPNKLLDTIGSTAASFGKDGAAQDIGDLSKSILEGIDQNDIQQFALNMAKNPSALSDLCTLASGAGAAINATKATAPKALD
ncbi:MAG: hypothetical protein ACO38I_03980 [Ilumatobacteraceae bacterium]